MENKIFNLRKRIASAGKNNIIVIPKILQDQLRKGMVVDLRINVVDSEDSEGEGKWEILIILLKL